MGDEPKPLTSAQVAELRGAVAVLCIENKGMRGLDDFESIMDRLFATLAARDEEIERLSTILRQSEILTILEEKAALRKRVAELEGTGHRVMPILDREEYGRHAAQGEHPRAQDIQAFRAVLRKEVQGE